MNTLRGFLGLLALAGLVACGGGGGGGVGSGDNFDGYRIPIAAGTGAALAGATVTVDGSGSAKTFTCSGNTDENGYITCDVPASYTPPFVITVRPADASANSIKTVVVSANKGTNPRAPATPLTNLLLEADWNFYQNATTDQAKVRLTARKKQISDALANVFTQILGDKAKNFDFLTDSSFVPGSNEGSDLLLDNISVDTGSLKVSLKKNANANVSFTANTDPSKSSVTPISVSSSDMVTLTTRDLKDFAGVYNIAVTYTSYNANGSVSAQTQTKNVQLALNSDGTFDSTLGTTRWVGTYKLNDKKTSVKITGTVGGDGSLVGSIDNGFNMALAYNTKGTGINIGQTTKGSVASTSFVPKPSQSSNSNSNTAPTVKTLSDFAGNYAITVAWRLLDDSTSGTDTGTVSIGNNGTVSSCTNFQIFVNCTGTLALNANSNGANLSINATGSVEGTRGGATVTATVNSTYQVSGTVSGKNANGINVAEGTFTGSKN